MKIVQDYLSHVFFKPISFTIEIISKYIIMQHYFGLSFLINIEKNEQQSITISYRTVPLGVISYRNLSFGIHIGSVVSFLSVF